MAERFVVIHEKNTKHNRLRDAWLKCSVRAAALEAKILNHLGKITAAVSVLIVVLVCGAVVGYHGGYGDGLVARGKTATNASNAPRLHEPSHGNNSHPDANCKPDAYGNLPKSTSWQECRVSSILVALGAEKARLVTPVMRDNLFCYDPVAIDEFCDRIKHQKVLTKVLSKRQIEFLTRYHIGTGSGPDWRFVETSSPELPLQAAGADNKALQAYDRSQERIILVSP